MLLTLLILLFVIIIPIILYNSLINKKNQVANSFGSVDVILKKRYDLIPQIVETVKGYTAHENETLKAVTKLRTQTENKNLTDNEHIALDTQITKALSGLFIRVENYPKLKASEQFLNLQKILIEIEEQISAARRAYNAAVTDFNNSVEMFPTNMVANMMGYQTKKLFEIAEGERLLVSIKGAFDNKPNK